MNLENSSLTRNPGKMEEKTPVTDETTSGALYHRTLLSPRWLYSQVGSLRVVLPGLQHSIPVYQSQKFHLLIQLKKKTLAKQ